MTIKTFDTQTWTGSATDTETWKEETPNPLALGGTSSNTSVTFSFASSDFVFVNDSAQFYLDPGVSLSFTATFGFSGTLTFSQSSVTISGIPGDASATGIQAVVFADAVILGIVGNGDGTNPTAIIRVSEVANEGTDISSVGTYTYFSTKYLINLCDVCGFKRKPKELRERWDGLMVCSPSISDGCWEPRHPQDFVRPIRDQVPPIWTRPEPEDVFVSTNTCTVYSIQSVAGYAVPGCWIAGLDLGNREPAAFI